MITQRPHFEELDWLDFAEGRLPDAERAALQHHLEGCTACAQRLASMQRLLRGLPHLRDHLAKGWSEHDTQTIQTAAARASDILDQTNAARGDLADYTILPAPSALEGLSEFHIIGALELARERLIDDFPAATRLVEWSAQATEVLASRAPLRFPGLAGSIGSYQAYLQLREGKPTEALLALDRARLLLNQPMPLRDLAIAFWSYVRAVCLQNLSRFPEAIMAAQGAQELYTAFGDDRHAARTQFLRAILIFDGGDPRSSLPLFETLQHDPALQDDKPIFAVLHLSLANNLVFVGNLARAKSIYAKAVGLLKATHQEDKMFRVRVGLADIAEREGRIQDALSINLSLRPEFLRRHLPWDEVRRELWIVRDLLALGRYAEARATCEQLVPRARDLSLGDEAIRALTYLAEAQEALDDEAVNAIEQDLTQIARGNPTRWSVA